MRLKSVPIGLSLCVVTIGAIFATINAQPAKQPPGPAPSHEVSVAEPADANQPLRVAIAGLVHGHAEGFFSMAVKRTDIQIVGIAEPDRALFDQYAKKYGLDPKLYHADLEELLSSTKPQAVLVYTNTFDHGKVVELCAKHRVAAMMEKPLAVSSEDAHAIAKAATAANIPVLVNYFTTWEPNRHGAYEVVREGTIGEVRKIVAHDGHKGPKEIGVGPEFLGWLTDPKLNGAGALYDFGCYGVDFMTWLMNGERPLTVTAVTQTIKPDVYPKVDDEAAIILTYPKAQGIVQASWNWPFGRSDLEIYGNTGEVETIGRDGMEVRTAGESAPKTVQAPSLMPPQDDELRYLRAVVLEGLKPEGPSSLQINVVVAEVMDAARESAKTGKTVKFASSK
ncbi:MAG: Gfo/Idh/MocA family oxidoreductase [Candidatus Acidiferrum sp.]